MSMGAVIQHRIPYFVKQSDLSSPTSHTIYHLWSTKYTWGNPVNDLLQCFPVLYFNIPLGSELRRQIGLCYWLLHEGALQLWPGTIIVVLYDQWHSSALCSWVLLINEITSKDGGEWEGTGSVFNYENVRAPVSMMMWNRPVLENNGGFAISLSD